MATKKIFPIKTVRDELTDFVILAKRTGQETIITRNGHPAAKIVGLTDNEIQEAEELLKNPPSSQS